MPKDGLVYDYMFDKSKYQWRQWMETVKVRAQLVNEALERQMLSRLKETNPVSQ
jgi:hypothetical protein